MLEYLMYIFSEQMCMFGYLKTPDIMLSIVTVTTYNYSYNYIYSYSYTKIGLDSYF